MIEQPMNVYIFAPGDYGLSEESTLCRYFLEPYQSVTDLLNEIHSLTQKEKTELAVLAALRLGYVIDEKLKPKL